MLQDCKLDLARDIGKVIPGLAPDINEMITTMNIPDTMAEIAYNELQEIEQIGFRVNDDFDMLMIAKGLKNVGLETPNGSGMSGSQPPSPRAYENQV